MSKEYKSYILHLIGLARKQALTKIQAGILRSHGAVLELQDELALHCWIPISEGLPKKIGARVLVYAKHEIFTSICADGVYAGGGQFVLLRPDTTDWEITHWMKLPTLPKGK